LFAVPSGLVAVLLLVVKDHVKDFFVESGIDAISGSQSWAAATGVLAILLSFRTRQALSRFWEGTGLLHQMRGEWFDSVSCCVTFSRAAIADKQQGVFIFRHTLVRLMSLCHGSALEEIADDAGNIATIDLTGLDSTTLRHLKECKEVHLFNRVEVILHVIQTLITRNLEIGILKIPPPILSRVYQTLSRGFVNLLNAKKITDTRFPFPYAQLISMLLMVHTLLTPVMICELIDHKVWAFIFTFVPIFGMFSLNFTASQLENPFGNDDNDLPLVDFQEEMNASLLMLLHANSDHIATVSSKCTFDFEELARSMNPGVAENGRGGIGYMLSNSPVDSPNNSPRGGNNDSNEAGTRAAAPETGKVGEAPPPPPVPKPPLPQAPPPTPQMRLMKGMDDFNMALATWTKTVDGQIGDLSRSFADLRKISDSMPALLESVKATRSVWKNGVVNESQDYDQKLDSLKAFPAI